MSKRSKIIRNLKKNYTYTLDQLQKDFETHPQTIRGWINRLENPLKCIHKKPTLVFSEDFRNFLRQESQRRKIILEPTQMLCMSCRKGKHPLGNQVHFKFNGNAVSLKGICPECRTIMNKQTSSKTLNQIMPLYQKVTIVELDILRNANKLDTTQANDKPAYSESEVLNNEVIESKGNVK
jgi:hypothetical protein